MVSAADDRQIKLWRMNGVCVRNMYVLVDTGECKLAGVTQRKLNKPLSFQV